MEFRDPRELQISPIRSEGRCGNAASRRLYYDCHNNGHVVIVFDVQAEEASFAAREMDLVYMAHVRSEVVAVALVFDVAGPGVPVVAAAGWEDELMVALQEVEKTEKLAGRTGVQEWSQQAMVQAETLPCAFELQASLRQSDQAYPLA